jgi:hypothetical protein
MGRNVFWWFFPVRTVENDGLEWKLSATYALEGDKKEPLSVVIPSTKDNTKLEKLN